MLDFLDVMYRVALNKNMTVWGDLTDGDLLVYEGYIYLVIGTDSTNECTKVLLQLADETSEFREEHVDDILGIKDYSKLLNNITQRSLNVETEMEVMNSNFRNYANKIKKLVPNVSWL